MVSATSTKAHVMGKALAEGGATLGFLQKYHLSPSIIPDILNPESILASSSTLPKRPSHTNLKATHS